MDKPLQLPIVQKFAVLVLNPAVKLLFALAVLYFIYGVFVFIKNSGESAGRIEGRNHILWSTVGLFIMVSVWGIISMIQKTFGQ
jgi:hypothetical protein